MRHHNARERDALFVLHRLADDDESLRPGFAVWCDVIGFIEIALVYLGPGYKAFDVDCVRALYLNRFQLVLVDFHVLALAELIAASFVRGIDRAAGLLIDHLLAQPVSGLLVDLVKMRFLALRCRGKQLDRAGHE